MPAISCSGQAVTPSTNVQAVINSAPSGTTFCFASGTYTAVSRLSPKAGDVFDGDNQKAILDGRNTLFHAFGATQSDPGSGQPELTVANVTIKGFVIEHYNPPQQTAAIEAFDTSGWVIENNAIINNAEMGVATGNTVQVLDNTINHNGREAYGAHGSGGLYQGNEMGWNNNPYNPSLPGGSGDFETGGGKAWATTNMTFSDNNVHDNGGNGVWFDTNNIGMTVDHNTVTNNWGAGIYFEISYNGSITNNTVEDNGMPSSPGGGQRLGYLWDAGIQLRGSGALSATSPLVISGNKVIDNYNGISLLQSPNGIYGACNTEFSVGNEGEYGPCLVQNVLVENNTISMTQGATGAVQDGAGDGIFTTQNNHFVGNHYTAGTSCCTGGYSYGWLAWADGWRSWAQWQSSNNDLAGSFGT
jgi:parallel beta-helix repeat protein